MSIGDDRAISHIREVVDGPVNAKKADLRGLVGLVIGKRNGVVFLTKGVLAVKLQPTRPEEGLQIPSSASVET